MFNELGWMRWFALLMVGACGRTSFASLDALASADAPPDAPLGAFSAPVLVTAVASAAFEGDVTLPEDMTELYFKSSRAGGLGGMDIWRVTRPTVNDAWGQPARVDELSGPTDDTSPRITPDGLTIWFARTPMTLGPNDTFVASRATRSDPWSTPVLAAGLDSTTDGKFGVATDTRLVAYLQSTRVSAKRIYRSQRASATDAWGTPQLLPELVAPTGFDENPWGTANDHVIVWASDRPGSVGGSAGSADIWMAIRLSVDEPFGPAIDLVEINSSDHETDPWISSDLRHIYFTSTRAGGGNYEIYSADR